MKPSLKGTQHKSMRRVACCVLEHFSMRSETGHAGSCHGNARMCRLVLKQAQAAHGLCMHRCTLA
eukprot:358727-Chlamydomonas_euryale.AAC.4